MTTVISGSSPSITFSDSTTQTTAFTSTPSVTTITTSSDASISGLTVGKGGGAVATNTAVGASALAVNSTGTGITSLGYQAGYTNVTGNYSTYIGGYAGNVATANGNTCVGYQSGLALNTGTSNTYIGAGSGYLMTTGAKNTIIGGYSGNQGGLDIRTASNYIVLSDGDGNVRQTIDSSGKVYIACTSAPSSTVAGVRLGNPNDALCAFSSGTATVETYQLGFYNGNGLVGRISTNGSATAYTTSSDYRLKENIAPMTGALAKVALLKPVTYKWKADGSDGEGFIAHELAEVCPHAVSGEKDAIDADGNPDYQAVDTSFLVATLTSAIQELKAEFDAYKATHP